MSTSKAPLRTLLNVLQEHNLLNRCQIEYKKNGPSEQIILSFHNEYVLSRSSEVDQWFNHNDKNTNQRNTQS
jgi:hypothetical protein